MTFTKNPFTEILKPVKRRLESAKSAYNKGRISKEQLGEVQGLRDQAYNSSSKKEIERVIGKLNTLPYLGTYEPRDASAAIELDIDVDVDKFDSDPEYRRAIQEKIKKVRQRKGGVDYAYQDELKDMFKRGLSVDSPEVIKFINRRAADKYNDLYTKSRVFSFETVNGLPDGDIIPESKKLVARLFEEVDKKEIQSLVRGVVLDQVDKFFKTGVVPTVDEIDHIFPGGTPRIINGNLVGGAVDEAGNFLGVGRTNSRNLQVLSKTLNTSLQNILYPEKIRLLGSSKGSLSVEESLANPTTRKKTAERLIQLGQWQRGEVDSQGNPVKKPVLRFGGHAYSRFLPYGFGTLLGLGLAGFSDKGWASDQFKKTVKDRSFWFENLLGLDSQKIASDPRRVSPWRIGATLGQDTASGIGGLLRGLLRTDDPTEDDYVAAQQMGRSPDMSTPQIYNNGKPTGIFGHPGIREEIIRKRRPNIWT